MARNSKTLFHARTSLLLIMSWEKSILTQPNMYARGILFGKMKYELGDQSIVRCPEHSLAADIDFKTKGYFGGGYNAIGGTIKNEKTQEVLYELSGNWTDEMFIQNVAVCAAWHEPQDQNAPVPAAFADLSSDWKQGATL